MSLKFQNLQHFNVVDTNRCQLLAFVYRDEFFIVNVSVSTTLMLIKSACNLNYY
jgi:hypothetical protein